MKEKLGNQRRLVRDGNMKSWQNDSQKPWHHPASPPNSDRDRRANCDQSGCVCTKPPSSSHETVRWENSGQTSHRSKFSLVDSASVKRLLKLLKAAAVGGTEKEIETVCLLVSLCFCQCSTVCVCDAWGRWVILHVSFCVPRVFFISSSSPLSVPSVFSLLSPSPSLFLHLSSFSPVTFLSSAQSVILVFCWLDAFLMRTHTHTPAVGTVGVYWIVCVLYLNKENKSRKQSDEGKNERRTRETRKTSNCRQKKRNWWLTTKGG